MRAAAAEKQILLVDAERVLTQRDEEVAVLRADCAKDLESSGEPKELEVAAAEKSAEDARKTVDSLNEEVGALIDEAKALEELLAEKIDGDGRADG